MIHIVEHLRKENAELRRQLAEVGQFYNINEQWVRIDEKVPSCICYGNRNSWCSMHSPFCLE